jgi:dTDP-4-amino-4,6-dideoxygalactose transaminase
MFFDYERLYDEDYPTYKEKLFAVLKRSDFIMREDLFEFERNMAEYISAKHCVGVGNGTDAIWLALLAAGVAPGHEVILPSHTYVATADAVKMVGAIPVLVDCDENHLIDTGAVEEAITSRTSAIIPVNLNGKACDLPALAALASKHGLKMIEDSAQGVGATISGRHAGTFGDFGTLSFFPAKNLGGIGDGGAVITNSDASADRIRELRNHGRDADLEVRSWGFNSRLDNIQAAVLDAKLAKLDATIVRRREIARTYQIELQDIPSLRLPPPPAVNSISFDSYQNYEIEANDRDQLRDFLNLNGVGTALPWGGKAVHHFDLPGVVKKDLSRTEALFEKVLLLPMNQYLKQDEVLYVTSQIRNFYESRRP